MDTWLPKTMTNLWISCSKDLESDVHFPTSMMGNGPRVFAKALLGSVFVNIFLYDIGLNASFLGLAAR